MDGRAESIAAGRQQAGSVAKGRTQKHNVQKMVQARAVQVRAPIRSDGDESGQSARVGIAFARRQT